MTSGREKPRTMTWEKWSRRWWNGGSPLIHKLGQMYLWYYWGDRI